MPVCRAVLAFFLASAVALGADPPTLTTLTGTKVTGELTGFNDKEIVLNTKDGPVTTPLTQVLQLNLSPAATLAKDITYTDVELTDGSLLRCSKFTVKGKQAEMTLLPGQQVKVPLEAISSVLSDAQDPKIVQDWKERFLSEKRTSDLVGIKSPNGRVERFKGTFGEGDEDGKTIQFDLNGKGNPRPVNLEKVHCMLFLRDATVAGPPVICKLQDTHKSLLVVSKATLGEAGFTITTPAGAKIDYAAQLVQAFDFSKGKLTFLSDLEPSRVSETSTEERVEHYRRDKNLDGQKIKLRIKDEANAGAGFKLQPYDKGLALHARTELEYELKGEYNKFEATLGIDEIDESPGIDGPTIVKVEADGRELGSFTITRKDEPKAISLSIKDAQRLRLVVLSGDLLDLGKHVVLAEARVSK